MIIYILNIIFLFIWWSMIEILKNKRMISHKQSRKILCIVAFLQLWIIAFLRDTVVGSDTQNYVMYFKEISYKSFPTYKFMGIEKGYVFLNSLISIFTQNTQIFFAIIAAIILSGYLVFIYKYSKNVFLSIYLLITFDYFSMSLNIYRQSIAMVLVLLSIKYIYDNKVYKFLLSIFIASLFHKTALIAFILYPLSKIKVTYKYITALIVVFKPIQSIISKIVNYIAINRYEMYYNNKTSLDNYTTLFIYIGILIGCWLFKRSMEVRGRECKNNKQEEHINLYFHCLILAIVFQFTATNMAIFTRAIYYFSVFIVILIPEVIWAIKDYGLKIFATVIALSISMFIYISMLNNNLSGVIPYVFFFN